MTAPSSTPGLWRTIGVFAAVGPLAGTVGVWLILAVIVGVASFAEPGGLGDLFGGPAMLPPFLLASLLGGYAAGVIPAVVTGAVCHLAASRAGMIVWLTVAAVTGFVVSAGAVALVALGTALTLWIGGVGAAASFLCAWLSRRRPRP